MQGNFEKAPEIWSQALNDFIVYRIGLYFILSGS